MKYLKPFLLAFHFEFGLSFFHSLYIYSGLSVAPSVWWIKCRVLLLHYFFFLRWIMIKNQEKTIRMLSAEGIHHNHVIENKGVRKKWTFFFLHFAHVKMNVKHASLSGKAPAMNFLWGFFFFLNAQWILFIPCFEVFFSTPTRKFCQAFVVASHWHGCTIISSLVNAPHHIN